MEGALRFCSILLPISGNSTDMEAEGEGEGAAAASDAGGVAEASARPVSSGYKSATALRKASASRIPFFQ
jgi:hypothetical protein